MYRHRMFTWDKQMLLGKAFKRDHLPRIVIMDLKVCRVHCKTTHTLFSLGAALEYYVISYRCTCPSPYKAGKEGREVRSQKELKSSRGSSSSSHKQLKMTRILLLCLATAATLLAFTG